MMRQLGYDETNIEKGPYKIIYIIHKNKIYIYVNYKKYVFVFWLTRIFSLIFNLNFSFTTKNVQSINTCNTSKSQNRNLEIFSHLLL